MNTIERLGEEETFKNIVEREITEFEDNKIDVIRDFAFYSYSTLKNVSFPVVTSIGISAFNGCNKLTSVSIPNATSIDYSAFQSCSGLTEVSFPVATSIGSGAFNGCRKLTTIYVGTNTSTVCTLGTSAFTGCTNLTNIYVPASLLDKYKSAANWSSYASKIKAAH